MTILTLAERLQGRFGGTIECQWGVPSDDYLAAYLKDVKTTPKKEELTEVITQYFANHGFKRIPPHNFLAFEDLKNENQRVACFTYSERLRRLIVSAQQV